MPRLEGFSLQMYTAVPIKWLFGVSWLCLKSWNIWDHPMSLLCCCFGETAQPHSRSSLSLKSSTAVQVSVLILSGEQAPWVEHLPSKYEILNLNPQNPHKEVCCRRQMQSQRSNREIVVRGGTIPRHSQAISLPNTPESQFSCPCLFYL